MEEERAKIMQTSAMKINFQIAECSLSSAKIIGISRHRLSTDGNGVTTLVAFHDCPLRCRYCLNPQSLGDGKRFIDYPPEELYAETRIDEHQISILMPTVLQAVLNLRLSDLQTLTCLTIKYANDYGIGFYLS